MKNFLISTLFLLLLSTTCCKNTLKDLEDRDGVLSEADVSEIQAILDVINDYLVVPSIVITKSRSHFFKNYDYGTCIAISLLDAVNCVYKNSNLNDEPFALMFVLFIEESYILWQGVTNLYDIIPNSVLDSALKSSKDAYVKGSKAATVAFWTPIKQHLVENGVKKSHAYLVSLIFIFIIIGSIGLCCYCCCCKRKQDPMGQYNPNFNPNQQFLQVNPNYAQRTNQ